MHARRSRFVLPLLAALGLAGPAPAATILIREFHYGPERVSLSLEDGATQVRVEGGVPERRAGRPDLPTVSEPIEVPVDLEITRVDVVSIELETLAERVEVPPAMVVSHESGPAARTVPDPAFYARPGPEPELPVSLGTQGFERGRRLAWLLVTPVRWDPSSGRLERVRRLVVRLTLETAREHPLARERVVTAWEDDRAASPPGAADLAPPRGVVRAAAAPQPFQPTQLPSLLGSPVAFVIVTNDSMAGAFQALADWKTQSGIPAAVRTLSFIHAQYPFGADEPERIRMFIRDAYTRWGTRWVLLGGDTEVIPPRLAHITLYGDDYLPTDLYYSCLDGTWNANGDSIYADGFAGPDSPGDNADLLPEVWVGRAPVATPADAQRFVQKTLTYEKTPVGDAMNQILFFAQVLFPEHWQPPQTVNLDGAQLVEQDLLPLLDSTPWIHAARLYQNETDPHWRPGALHETRAVVLDSLERGYNIAVHVGHGYRTVMSCGDDDLTNNDVNGLENGDRLTNVYSVDCTSNAIDYASIGEALMRAPRGGAVTNIGSTSLDFPTIARAYQKEYFRLLLRDSVTAIGEAQARQKLPQVGRSSSDTFDRWTQFALLLLGDPELRVFTARPRELEVTAPATVAADDTSLAVQVAVSGAPLFGARVTAWMPGHEYRTALTDGAGNVTLPFHPDSLGSATLTVTAFNARPWQQPLAVVAGAPAALEAQPAIVVDDPLGGRKGNGNGIPEAGEQVDVLIPVRNAGGTGAAAVTGTLGTADPQVSILQPAVSYGSIDPGTTTVPAAGFRVAIASGCPDQREVAFTLDLLDAESRHVRQSLRLLVRSPELVQVSHTESELGGNDDGRPQPGETVTYVFRVRNLGTGAAQGLSGRFRSLDGLAEVLDSTFTLPDLPAGAEAASSPVRFVPASADARIVLEVDDADGIRLSQTLDLGYPGPVGGLAASCAPGGRVLLAWAHSTTADLAGYNIYRGALASGPFVRLTPTPTGRSSTWVDEGLAPLARFYYEVAAVDSSGNESAPSAAVSAVTNPALHAGFPQYTRESAMAPVAVERVEPGPGQDLLVGGDVLHLFRADGTAPVDADGASASPGDFTTLGSYYASGGSISDLDGDGHREIIGAAWTSQQLLVFDAQGRPRPGFPVAVEDQMWSAVAVGDLDGDGHKEMVFASRSPLPNLGRELYAFRSDGTEWRDGDSNPATNGVFKVMGSNYNDGTPALADLLGNGQLDIVFGGFDGNLYAWKPDGSNVPGFPVAIGAAMSASVAIGRLDGPAGPLSIVVPATDNTLRVLLSDGSSRPGFPVFVTSTGTNRGPSPALADMNGDGLPEIVFASTNGQVYVFDRNGAQVPPWTSSRFSTLTASATEGSPVVADLDGDGRNDVVIGDEAGDLAALSGASGAMLPGFPIHLDAEASGTAAVCDCDGDGMTEIVESDYGGTLYMWDYDFPFSPAGPPPWPQFHHDAERTGNLQTPALVKVAPQVEDAPRALEIGLPRPNPGRSIVRLEFGVPAEQSGAAIEVAIFDLAGRRVRTLTRGTARAGRGSLSWDLRDARGAPAPSGVYLVRLAAGPRALTRKVVVLR